MKCITPISGISGSERLDAVITANVVRPNTDSTKKTTVDSTSPRNSRNESRTSTSNAPPLQSPSRKDDGVKSDDDDDRRRIGDENSEPKHEVTEGTMVSSSDISKRQNDDEHNNPVEPTKNEIEWAINLKSYVLRNYKRQQYGIVDDCAIPSVDDDDNTSKPKRKTAKTTKPNDNNTTIIISDIPNVSQITDYEYLQHAIVAKGDIHKAIVRIRRIQIVKQELGISSSSSSSSGGGDDDDDDESTSTSTTTTPIEDAERDLSIYERTFAQNMLSIAHHPTTHLAVACIHNANRRFRQPESFNVFFRVLYYMLEAMTCDVQSIRAGFVFLCDAQGIGIQNIGLRHVEDRGAHIYSKSYPIIIRQIVLMKLSPISHFLYGIFSRLSLSSKIRQRVVFRNDMMDYLFEHRSTYPLEVLPTSWGGTIPPSDFGATLLSKLRRRHENVQTFRLSLSSPSDATTVA